MKQYFIIHNHRFGTTPYFFRCEADLYGSPEMDLKLAEALNIDFEPDRDEDLELHICESDENPVIPAEFFQLEKTIC